MMRIIDDDVVHCPDCGNPTVDDTTSRTGCLAISCCPDCQTEVILACGRLYRLDDNRLVEIGVQPSAFVMIYDRS